MRPSFCGLSESDRRFEPHDKVVTQTPKLFIKTGDPFLIKVDFLKRMEG